MNNILSTIIERTKYRIQIKKNKLPLETIKENPNITTQELSKKVGISDRKIKDNIKKLKENNLLERIGPAKGGHWKIK